MKEFYRGLMYCIGLLLLAIGIILNTKTGLGVPPIISIPYSIANIWKISLGNATLGIYILCVLGQMALRGKKFRLFDFWQIPMSIIFSRVINFFNDMIIIDTNNLILKLLLLVAAILLTGVGVAISVEMNLVPNAADGLTQALGERMQKDLGYAKNVLDLSFILLTIVISLLFSGKVIGMGIGTLASMIGVGRSIALFNLFFRQKMILLLAK